MNDATPRAESAAYAGPRPEDFDRALAWCDGQWVPLAEARVPIRDFGFTRADQTYEVVHVWQGGFFRLEDHLDRFAESCAGFRLVPPVDRAGLAALLHALVRRTGLRFATVWWACTRGVAARGSRDPRTARNTLYATATPLVPRADAATMARGIAVGIHPSIRRIPPDSIDPRHKNTHWADFTRAEFDVREAGFDLPVLLDRDGLVTEGIGCNVVAIVNGELVTPAEGCLVGVSAMAMIEIARELGIPARYGLLGADDLRGADEAFVTSTTAGLIPVTRVDARTLGDGAPGPITRRLLAEYRRRKDAGWHITPIDYGEGTP
jgi:branched-chain amino acid aminotransferase